MASESFFSEGPCIKEQMIREEMKRENLREAIKANMMRQKHHDYCEHQQDTSRLDTSPDLVPKYGQMLKVGAKAVGALAIGALAFGALAIGALAIGRLVIGRSRIKRLEIDELVVDNLHIRKRSVTDEPELI